MINVTVINLKSISKYLLIAIIIVGIVTFARSFSKNITFNRQAINVSMVGCLKETLPKIDENNSAQKIRKITSNSRSSNLKRMLNAEIPMLDNLIVDGEESEEIKPSENIKQQEENLQVAETNVTTQEVQENNITPKYNNVFGTVKVKNESDKEITQEILTPNISLEDNKDIILFHTHTCESYTPSENFNYEMTGSYRTTDLNYSVARVGTELEKYLKNYGYNVIHDQTYHDYPAYNGSYGRSLTTVKNILSTNSNAQVVIDLHRDAVRE